jgi:ribonuclease D
MHAGRQDLELFNDLRGTPPTPVFDTQVAATLTGYGDQVGYGPLVETIVGVKLDKAHTRTDWCRRPLSEAQIRYAEDDVRYLRDIYQFLDRKVEEMGRAQWLQEELERLTNPETYNNDPDLAYRRLKRGHLLRPPAQHVLRSLAAWRERCAQEANLPRSWVADDAVLTALAGAAPTTREGLLQVDGVKESLVRKWGADILEAIQAGTAEAPQPLWENPVRLTNEQRSLADRMMKLVRERAERNQLAPAVLGTRREVDRFILGDDSVALLQGWRWHLIGQELLDLRTGS